MLLTFLIPCLNEEKTVTRVVKEAFLSAQKNGISDFEIIVADNGSTDKSVILLKKQGIAKIIPVPIKGYGAALHYGILAAKGNYILYADADQSYSFSELYKFLPYVKSKKMDLVLGSRFKGTIKPNAMPIHHRYLGTPVLTYLINIIYKLPTSDCNSGMRMIRRRFYSKLKMNNIGMEWASELLINSALANAKYIEVPITLYKDKRGKKPHLVSWVDGWRHLKAIVLLKPKLLFIFVILFSLVSIITININYFLTLFFIFTGSTLFLCTLAAVLIHDAINNQKSKISKLILNFPLVRTTFLLFILTIIVITIFPNTSIEIKFLLLNITFIYSIWVFFIETVKTHLVNKLR